MSVTQVEARPVTIVEAGSDSSAYTLFAETFAPPPRLVRAHRHGSPTLAVLMARLPEPGPDKDEPHETHFLRELFQAARRRGLAVYVVTAAQVTERNAVLAGYELAGNRWRCRLFPWPDATYDRIHSRRMEHRPSVRRARNLLVPRWNSRMLTKWETYCALSRSPVLRHLLPVTARVAAPEDVQPMLEAHGWVCVKPDDGSLGHGVAFLRRHGTKVEVRRERSWGVRIRRFDSLTGAMESLKAYRQGHPYLVQPALRLARHGGSVFDLRVLVQKDRRGRWRATSTVARLAEPGRLISNRALGALLVPAWRVVGRAVSRRAGAAARAAAAHLERELDLELGELGLDLVIDSDRRMWILEANSRPSKRFLPRRKPRLSVARTLDYASFLSRARSLRSSGSVVAL